MKSRNPIASQLSSAVKGAWESPEGMQLREQLSSQAYSSGFASCLSSGARRNEAFSEVVKRCMAQSGYAMDEAQDWGSTKVNAPMVRGVQIARTRL